jgi:hypothetical protein
MAYTKQIWQDEVLSDAERFKILDNAGLAVDAWADLANCQIKLSTDILTSGTPLDAAHLNHIEDGIEEISTGAARSVKGVAGAAAGDVDDIEAATDGHVLRRSGASIGFGQLAAAAIPDNLITELKLAAAVIAKLVTNGNSHDHVGGDGAPITPGATDFFSDSKIYSGRIGSTGNIIKAPSGWSITKLATGRYRINHTMGTANFTFTGNADNKFVIWYNKTSTTIEIHTLGYAAGVMGYYDAEWHFIIIKD